MLVDSASTSTSQRLSWRHELSAQARWRCASSSTPNQPNNHYCLGHLSGNATPNLARVKALVSVVQVMACSILHAIVAPRPPKNRDWEGGKFFRLGRAPRHGRVELPSHDAGSKPSVDLRDPLVMALRRKVPRPPASCMHAVSCCPFAHVQDCHSLDIRKCRSSAQVQ